MPSPNEPHPAPHIARRRGWARAAAGALCAAALACGISSRAAAQVVRGRVVDGGRRQPARGAVVSLEAADDRRLVPALTDSTGAFIVAAPAPGSYRVRVDLIGYEAWQSEVLALRGSDTTTLDVALPLRRVLLTTVKVESESKCNARPQDGARTVALWEEIRRALTISEITARRQLVPLDLVMRERQVQYGNGADRSRQSSPGPETITMATNPGRMPIAPTRGNPLPQGGGLPPAAITSSSGGGGAASDSRPRENGTSTRRVVTYDRTERVRGGGARPWSSPPVEELVAAGFVQSIGGVQSYYAPDIPVLLSDAFLSTHCFRPVRRGGLLKNDAIGLAFEPVAGRALADVKGTIWLDAGSSELRSMEFTYVGLPKTPGIEAGGELAFSRLPTGEWYVQQWALRRPTTRPLGERERVGEATPIGRTKGAAYAPLTVTGTVVDSTSGAGLADAVVFLPGAPQAISDSLGRFTIVIGDAPTSAIDYMLVVEHPRFAAIGLTEASQRVQLAGGTSRAVAIATPSVPTLLRALCPADGETLYDAKGALRIGLVLGRAFAADGTPLPLDTRVVAEWPSDEALGAGTASRTKQVAARTDAEGRFRLCSVAVGRSVQLYIDAGGAPSGRTEFVVPALGLGEVELTRTP